MHANPVVVLDPDGFYEPLWAYLKGLARKGFVREAAFASLRLVRTVPDAMDALASVT
jgi:predicted Rossmann-fold nucleotide-binding protein